MNITPRWKRFETSVIKYHAATTGHCTYAWADAPEHELRRAGIIVHSSRARIRRRLIKSESQGNTIQEFGLDGLAREDREDGSVVYHGIQAKCWHPETTRPLVANDLGSFFVVQHGLSKVTPDSTGFLYTTGRVHHLTRDHMENAGYNIVDMPYPDEEGEEEAAPQNARVELRPYQGECVRALAAGWDKVGLLSMPCGTGKTECVCAWLAEACGELEVVVMASPLLALVDQTKRRMEAFVPHVKHVLVDGEGGGVRDFEQLQKIVDEADVPVVLHTTFKSAEEVISPLFKLLKDTKAIMLVVDEAHNVPGRPGLRKVVEEAPMALLVTATPTTVMREQMDMELIYEMPVSRAIEEGWIVDYEVYLPVLCRRADGSTEVDVDAEVEEVSALDDQTMVGKALFLARGMLETGSRRCIVYLNSVRECELFQETMAKVVGDYHSLPYWGGVVTEDVRREMRRKLIEEFQAHDPGVLKVLACVHVLKEGVDIPRCDSVFLTSVSEHANEARIVQMAMRSNRLDPLNPTKKASIFMWTDDWTPEVNALTMLKEMDGGFTAKVRALHADYDRSTDAATQAVEEIQTGELSRFVEVKCLSYAELLKRRCEELAQFAEEKGQLPAMSDKTVMIGGAVRGQWVNGMKKALKGRGSYRLTAVQRDMLLNIPAVKEWFDSVSNEEPRENRDFSESVAELREHVERVGRLPTKTTNRKLYYWLHNQKFRIDALPEDRKAALFAIEGVRELFGVARRPRPSWAESCERVRLFTRDKSRLPTRTNDKCLARWCDNQVQDFAKHNLADDRIAQLLRIPLFKEKLERRDEYNTHPYVIKHSLQTS